MDRSNTITPELFAYLNGLTVEQARQRLPSHYSIAVISADGSPIETLAGPRNGARLKVVTKGGKIASVDEVG